MKKILFLCDGDNFPKGASEFIKQLGNKESVFVKGLFFTPIDIEQLIPISYIPISEPYVKLKEHEKELVQKSQEYFVQECKSSGIRYQVHSYSKDWNKEILGRESRYSDLIVISEELFCCNTVDSQPNYFMEETLRLTECPVVVIPENFHAIERLAIAYDGKKEGMYALKQFTYLFPDFMELPAELVHIKNEKSEEIPDQDLLKEYTSVHFESQFTSKLHFDPKKYFPSWLENKKNVLLVTGSYSRSAFSNIFRQSFVRQVIARHACPVFIAHFS
jgi:hypothetical protein